MPASPRRKKLHVALTGFSGLEDPGSGSSVAHALRQGWLGELAISGWMYGHSADSAWLPDVIDRLQVLPPLAAGEEALLEAVVAAHVRTALDAFVPGEADVGLIAGLADRLAGHGIRTLLPCVARAEALRRINLSKFLHNTGIPGLLTAHVAKIVDAAPLADHIGYPLCVRGEDFGEQVVYSAQQAASAAERLMGAGQSGVTLQYQLAGDRYSVGLVADRAGRCQAVVPIKIVALNGEGRTVTGTVVDLKPLDRFAQDFVDASAWCGPLTLELVQPFGSGRPLVCDVKRHLPAWCQASHWGGANLAVVLLQEMLCLRHKTARPRPGTMFVRSVAESPVALGDLVHLKQHGRLDAFARVDARPAPRIGSKKRQGVTVAITGTSTYDVVNAGLGVARALRRAPGIGRVLGLCYGTLESGSYQPALFDEVFRLPDGSYEALSQRIEAIHRRCPFDVLIPCLDGELPWFIRMRDQLDALGIRHLLPDQKAFDRRSKRELFGGSLRTDWGSFRLPQSRLVRSQAETEAAIQSIGLPAVVKGPLFLSFPVQSMNQARGAWQQLAAAGWLEAIVQRKISGPHYATSVVCDRAHKTLHALTIKKLTICQRGSTWSAMQVREPRLEADFAHFLHTIKWTGPGEGEFIRDEVTDQFYLIEANPRFTAWIYYSAALGCNQPALAVRAALGAAAREALPVNDVVFMRRTTELPIRASQLAALATKGYLHHA